ncbi:MAG: hypothetical protein M1405_02025 [Patescibacteria group bacterium]|nr:hypothetical protein [Patescibacteria group bacterium]
MEINRGSIRDVNWHPRRLPAQPGNVPAEAAYEEEPTIDPETRAEIETRIIAHFPPEKRAELFRQEGVSPNDYLSRSFMRRVKDFLQI